MGQVGITKCENYDYDKVIGEVAELLSNLDVPMCQTSCQ